MKKIIQIEATGTAYNLLYISLLIETTLEVFSMAPICKVDHASGEPCHIYSRRELCNQLVDVDNDIVNPGPHSSLRLKHPCHKLMKSIRICRLRSSRPFDLSIYNGQLKRIYPVPEMLSQMMINNCSLELLRYWEQSKISKYSLRS